MPKAPDPAVDPAAYLRSIGAVRERCQVVMDRADKDELEYFSCDMGKMEDTARFVVGLIKVCIPTPPGLGLCRSPAIHTSTCIIEKGK